MDLSEIKVGIFDILGNILKNVSYIKLIDLSCKCDGEWEWIFFVKFCLVKS